MEVPEGLVIRCPMKPPPQKVASADTSSHPQPPSCCHVRISGDVLTVLFGSLPWRQTSKTTAWETLRRLPLPHHLLGVTSVQDMSSRADAGAKIQQTFCVVPMLQSHSRKQVAGSIKLQIAGITEVGGRHGPHGLLETLHLPD